MAGPLHRKRELDQDSDVRITGPEHSSVGWEGVAESMRYTPAESGPVRGAKTLPAMNQADGCVVTMEDITEHADLLMIVGQNPGTNHPRMLTALEQAKKRGARIIAINPLPEAGFGRFHNPQTVRGLAGPGTRLADAYLPIRVNGDLAFFNALNRVLPDREEARPGTVFDHDFIDRYCEGFEEVCEGWRALDWEQELSGLSRRAVERCADEVMSADSVIVCWAMGLTQHRNAVPTIREIVNFLLLRGNIGRPGAGPSPIRGHSNVQGDRTVGIWEQMPDRFLDGLRDEFGFEPPREHGWDTVGAIRAMRDGKVDVFFAVGGNFAAATPDTAVTEAAVADCGLTVNVATKLNRTHLCHGTEALLPRGPHASRTFPTKTGKARFTVNPPTAVQVPPGHLGGDMVDLVSVYADGERRAPGFRAVSYPIPRGCAAAYYPETNVLAPLDSVAETSNTPNTKSIVIRLEPSVAASV